MKSRQPLILTIALITAGLSSCSSTSKSQVKDLEHDTQATINNNDGTVTVYCKNGTSSRIPVDTYRKQVANDTICGATQEPKLLCRPRNEYNATLVRLSDGKELGSEVSTKICKKALAAASGGKVCAYRNEYNATILDTTTLKPFGSEVSQGLCLDILAKATRRFICMPRNDFNATIGNAIDGSKIGSEVDLALCSRIVAETNGTFICAPRNNYNGTLYNLETRQSIGGELSLEKCLDEARALNKP